MDNMKNKVMALLLLACGMNSVALAQHRLPAAIVKTIHGEMVKTDTLSNGGKPLVISFFATWCKPCNRELTAIADCYADWREETGMRLIAVSIDQAQNVNKVKPLADASGWEYDILLDTNGDFKRALGINMIPYTLLIDGRGNIVDKHNGYTDGDEKRLIEKIRTIATHEK